MENRIHELFFLGWITFANGRVSNIDTGAVAPTQPANPAEKPPAGHSTVSKPKPSVPTPSHSDLQLLEEAIADLPKGNLAYSAPKKMKTGETAHIIASIASNKVSIISMEKSIPASPETQIVSTATPVSTKMKMTLRSSDFDVTALSSEEQFIAGDAATTWQWDIAPRHAGELRLHLAAVVELNGLSKDFTTVDRDIDVQVDPIDALIKFVKANGVWILTSLGAALAAAWAWLKRRKKSQSPKWSTP